MRVHCLARIVVFTLLFCVGDNVNLLLVQRKMLDVEFLHAVAKGVRVRQKDACFTTIQDSIHDR